MIYLTELRKPRIWDPSEPLDKATYCSQCKFFEPDLLGHKEGNCFGIRIEDSTNPMLCPFFHNDIKILAVLLYLENGISVYHKAVIEDMETQMDPQLISSFLRAINTFGKELTREQLTQLQFQQMTIFVCRGKYIYGALLVKGNVDEDCKDTFKDFVTSIEREFSDYFEGVYTGICLPEEEVDIIAMASMQDYLAKKYYDVPPDLIQNCHKLKCVF